jgi:hypothetical protein
MTTAKESSEHNNHQQGSSVWLRIAFDITGTAQCRYHGMFDGDDDNHSHIPTSENNDDRKAAVWDCWNLINVTVRGVDACGPLSGSGS